MRGLLSIGVIILISSFSFSSANFPTNHESLALKRLMKENEPNFIIAEGEGLVDTNKFTHEYQAISNYKKYGASQILQDRQTAWYKSHYDKLVQGIPNNKLDYTSLYNSVIYIFGEKAFSVALNGYGQSVVGAALFGKGKIVVLGRSDYLEITTHPSMSKFVKNCIDWFTDGKSSGVKIGTHNAKPLIGFNSNTQTYISPLDLGYKPNIKIFKVDAHNEFRDDEIKALQEWVEKGGNLIIGGQSWSFGKDKEERILNFPGNKIVTKFGLGIGETDWSRIAYDVTKMPLPQTNLLVAITSPSTDSVASSTRSYTIDALLFDKTIEMPSFAKIIEAILKKFKSLDAIKNKEEYSSYAQSVMVITMKKKDIAEGNLPVASDLATFPYEVPANAKVESNVKLSINGDYKGYPEQYSYSQAKNSLMMSTGLYCKAGSIVTLTFPSTHVGKNIEVQVGSHTDNLIGKKPYQRSPQITLKYKVESNTIRVANPWGGLVYVNIPWGSKLGNFDVVISGGIRAPHFILGKTTDDEWSKIIRDYPAPWAEMEVPGQLTLTVPSSDIRKLDQPTRVMKIWEKAMIAANELAGYEGGKRPRHERMVFDIQISAGWMHSGYPLMSQMPPSKEHFDYDKLIKEGYWGTFHEIGHNQQWNSWTIDRTQETTNNLWSLYMNEKVFGIKNQHPATKPDSVKSRLEDFILKGRKASEWEVWTALITYSKMAEIYGWQSYINVFKKYFTMPEITDDNTVLDTWAKLYTQEVKQDLCDYFEWFRFPLTAETKKVCQGFPKPKVNPLADYQKTSTPTSTPTNSNCKTGWIPVGNSCFFFSQEKLDWWSAEEKCAEIGGSHLASCLTKDEFNMIIEKTKKSKDQYFIGLSDLAKHDNKYLNLDGTTASNVPWDAYSPFALDTSHCAAFTKGKVLDWSCNENQKFICKTGGANKCDPKVTCKKGWILFSDKCYLFNYKTKVSFNEAKNKCKAESSGLVEIGSKEEQTFLVHQTDDLAMNGKVGWTVGYWIGFERQGSVFKWISGNPSAYQDAWCEGQPSGTGHAILNKDMGGCWDDDTRNNAFICEAPANFK